MIGASRGSLEQAQGQLDARVDDADFWKLPGELRAVSTLVGRQSQLRGALSDGGTQPAARAAIVARVLDGKVSELAVQVVADVVSLRWSEPRDMVDTLEMLGTQAAFTIAEREGRLDQIENELFAFGRAYDASPRLQLTLTDTGLPTERKIAVLRSLLDGRVQTETLQALEHVAGDPRGRRLENAIEDLVEMAAVRRQSLAGVATVARPLDPEQQQRLTDALARIYGRGVNLQEVVDPNVVGGIRVQVGDEVFDGTVANRLEQVRRRIG